MNASVKKPRARKATADALWAPIPNYEGLYEVSSLGHIRSIPRHTATGLLGGRILAVETCKNGYLRATLSQAGKCRRILVHRAVLLAFQGSDNGREARHLNGVRSDNRLANLAWGTRSENARDRVRHGTQYDNRGERHGNSRLTNVEALAIKSAVLSGQTKTEVARQFGVSAQTVGYIANGRGWKHLVGNIHA